MFFVFPLGDRFGDVLHPEQQDGGDVFSGDWDVHWGYDLDFDPQPCWQILSECSKITVQPFQSLIWADRGKHATALHLPHASTCGRT